MSAQPGQQPGQPLNPAHFPQFYIKNDIQHSEPRPPGAPRPRRAPRIYEPRPPQMVALQTASWGEYLRTEHTLGLDFSLRGVKVYTYYRNEDKTVDIKRQGVLLGGPDQNLWVQCKCDECISKPLILWSDGGCIFYGNEWCKEHCGKFVWRYKIFQGLEFSILNLLSSTILSFIKLNILVICRT